MHRWINTCKGSQVHLISLPIQNNFPPRTAAESDLIISNWHLPTMIYQGQCPGPYQLKKLQNDLTVLYFSLRYKLVGDWGQYLGLFSSRYNVRWLGLSRLSL